jgi:hypothetical protein
MAELPTVDSILAVLRPQIESIIDTAMQATAKVSDASSEIPDMTTRRAARSLDMSVIFKTCVDAIMKDISVVMNEKVCDVCEYGFKLGYESAKSP